MIKILRFLFSRSLTVTAVISLTGILSGLCSAGLVAVINAAVHQSIGSPLVYVVGVLGLGLGKVVAGAWSHLMLLRFAQNTLLELSVELARGVLGVSYRHIEKIGMHRVLTALTEDVLVLAAALQVIPTLAVSGAVVIGCGAYLLWLTPVGFSIIASIVLVGTLIYKLLHSRAFQAIFAAREGRDRLMRHFRALTDGIKELKMNARRRGSFLEEEIEATGAEVKRQNLFAAKRYLLITAWSQGLFYLTTAGMLLVFPLIGSSDPEILTGYVFAALYVMTPVWSIIGALPTFVRGAVSLDKIEALGISLSRSSPPHSLSSEPMALATRLQLKEVEYRYENGAQGDHGFVLGPLDFSIGPGEIVFVVGGNGSGKSTFVKTLVGLYPPSTGEIRVGDSLVDDANREQYRQQFSVVFSDFFLFDQLRGVACEDVDAAAAEKLALLELTGKVAVQDAVFSTTALSQGQRKRLALLTALLEDRPIYVFDEWAADQDPHYKEIFYLRLLPALKAAGKAIVVITHDDRYFDQGDRIFKLEDGKPIAS